MKVYIIAQFFPPLNVIGSVRAYQLAKYLVDKGYEVIVFTSKDNYSSHDYIVDLSGVDIKYVNDSKIVKLLDGENKKYNNIKILKQLARTLIYPDHYIFKVNQYINSINDEIESNGKPDLIFTMALPFSLHLVGQYIKERNPEVKWIADNRDLWAISPYRKWPTFLRFFDKKYEKNILSKCDLITVVTNHMKLELEKYIDNNIKVVLNGFSENSLNKISKISEGYVYTGTLYNGLRDLTPLFNALSILKVKDEIQFYGSEKNIVLNYCEKFKKLKIIYNGKVSKDKIKEIQRNSKYLILALGKNSFEKGVLTGKFFEYVGAGKPIIAICDDDSELAELINKHKLGVATRDEIKIVNFLKDEGFSLKIPKELNINYQFDIIFNLNFMKDI